MKRPPAPTRSASRARRPGALALPVTRGGVAGLAALSLLAAAGCLLAGRGAAAARPGRQAGAGALAATLPGLSGPAAPALDGNRAPFRMRFAPDGKRLYVTESESGTVAVIDPAAGRVLDHLSTGGEQPAGLELAPGGELLAVANSYGDSVTLIDLRTGRIARRLPLRGMPCDVAFTPDGSILCVALCQLDEVALVDIAKGEVAARIPVGSHPRALAITRGGLLVCLNSASGSVSVIDVQGQRVVRRIQTPAVNLRGVALRPDGRVAYVTGQRAQNERPTETAVGVWSNQMFAVSLGGGIVDNIWLDLLGKNAADPDGVALSADGSRAYVACGGGHTVQSIRLGGDGYDLRLAADVGCDPRGVALSPDGKEVWVANYLGNNLTVLDAATLAATRRIALGSTPTIRPGLLGEYLFRSSTITRGGQFSCNSCHTEGGVDGISWKFVHVPDGLQRELRNVRSLRGPLRDTPPYRWTGHARDLPTFIREEVQGLLQGPPLPDDAVRALAEYIASLPLPRNPYRNEDGSLSTAAQRGEMLFDGKGACGQCHSGPHRGGQRSAWIGTTPEGVLLDVPHLEGVYDTPPYLHDGRATTLEDIFERHDPDRRHGAFSVLSPAEKSDLVAFLREL
jgi:YVTN family beta-propeller protein